MKCCIFGLVRGHARLGDYVKLRKRNRLIEKNVNKDQKYDMIIFHEGNIKPEHQKVMQNDMKATLRFVNVSDKVFSGYHPESLIKLMKTDPNARKRLGYKHMCRFNGIVIYDYLQDYDYAMRADDDIFIHTPFDTDPFEMMRDNNLIFAYGKHNIDPHKPTLQTFFPFVKQYIKENSVEINCDMTEINNNNFYNNFYITNVSFWNQERVKDYLKAVDNEMGIFKFRWGDSPIQATALKMFSHPNQWHHFKSIRYSHTSHRWQNTGPESNTSQWKPDVSKYKKDDFYIA